MARLRGRVRGPLYRAGHPGRPAPDRARARSHAALLLGRARVRALYYALWAVADVAILSGRDWGWALRLVPNQLYYGLLVPLCYALFFAERAAAASTSTHAAR